MEKTLILRNVFGRKAGNVSLPGSGKGTGVVPISSTPDKVTPGTIYYNTREDKYFIGTNDGLKPISTNSVDVTSTITTSAIHTVPGKDNVLVPDGYILKPGVFYDYLDNWVYHYVNVGTSGTLTIDNAKIYLDPYDENAIYSGRFTVTTDTPNITWPTGVTLPDEDNETFAFQANHRYEFNIFRGILFLKDVTVENGPDNDNPDPEPNPTVS